MWLVEFFHVMFGIFWIGLLWFFNLVQVPSMPKMTEAGAAKPYSQIILFKALWWFRHMAWLTVLTGLIYYILGRGDTVTPGGTIMIGMTLGVIMAFNVWVFIWPNQKKIIGGALEGDALAKAKKTALFASRFNAITAIPMLMCMVVSSHGSWTF